MKRFRRTVGQGLERWFQGAIHRLATRDIDSEATPQPDLWLDFTARCWAMSQPSILELGTKRWNPDMRTRHDDWVPNAGEYIGSDISDGQDVDLVADVHRLTQVTGEERFDAIISCSTFEHLKYPHLAAHELMKALRIGGILFIQTHQSFPLHAYPYDYFRFSREGLAGLFGTKMGLRVIATDYQFPVKLYSQRDPRAASVEAFLNVHLYGEKTAATPAAYAYEYDAT